MISRNELDMIFYFFGKTLNRRISHKKAVQVIAGNLFSPYAIFDASALVKS